MINNFYHTIIDQQPDRFRAYGVVPLPHVEEAIQEGKRIIEELGFLGIAVNTVLETGQSIADDAFLPFFEAMDALGAIIYIHPTGCGALSPMVNDYDQEWVVVFPFKCNAFLIIMRTGVVFHTIRLKPCRSTSGLIQPISSKPLFSIVTRL